MTENSSARAMSSLSTQSHGFVKSHITETGHRSNRGVECQQARSREARVESHAKARFLTVAEVAELMRVSTMTVYRLIKAGDMAAVRVGKSYRVREDDVDRYLASRYNATG